MTSPGMPNAVPGLTNEVVSINICASVSSDCTAVAAAPRLLAGTQVLQYVVGVPDDLGWIGNR